MVKVLTDWAYVNCMECEKSVGTVTGDKKEFVNEFEAADWIREHTISTGHLQYSIGSGANILYEGE